MMKVAILHSSTWEQGTDDIKSNSRAGRSKGIPHEPGAKTAHEQSVVLKCFVCNVTGGYNRWNISSGWKQKWNNISTKRFFVGKDEGRKAEYSSSWGKNNSGRSKQVKPGERQTVLNDTRLTCKQIALSCTGCSPTTTTTEHAIKEVKCKEIN